ncbi:MAG: hypothetical protein ACLQMF_15860, partial [Rectinemataceae bacterium]
MSTRARHPSAIAVLAVVAAAAVAAVAAVSPLAAQAAEGVFRGLSAEEDAALERGEAVIRKASADSLSLAV